MEEEDKKVELDSDIWKKYEKKEAKNLKKIIGACILAQTQTSSIEEAKQICVDKFK